MSGDSADAMFLQPWEGIASTLSRAQMPHFRLALLKWSKMFRRNFGSRNAYSSSVFFLYTTDRQSACLASKRRVGHRDTTPFFSTRSEQYLERLVTNVAFSFMNAVLWHGDLWFEIKCVHFWSVHIGVDKLNTLLFLEGKQLGWQHDPASLSGVVTKDTNEQY